MTDLAARLAAVRAGLGEAAAAAGRTDDVTLVAVSKTFPAEAVREAFECGHRVFGENRVQEAVRKRAELPALGEDIEWHLIGQLQRNKVGAAVETFSMIESVDSLRLAHAIESRAEATGRSVPALFEINVAGEESKSGFAIDEFLDLVPQLLTLSHLVPRGLMTVAPLVADPQDVRPVFARLRGLRDTVAEQHDLPKFRELSMGMSNDYREAILEGATIVRLGRAIFGERPGN